MVCRFSLGILIKDSDTVFFRNNAGGDIILFTGEVTFDSDLLTLTCISTGGPATTVTWTRDSITVTEGTETVLDDPETAQYTHTLTVTTGGEYTCTVSNNKPSSASASITLGYVLNKNNARETIHRCGTIIRRTHITGAC